MRQIDHGNPEPAQKFKPVVFFLWLAKQLDLAEEGKRQVNDKHDAQVICRRLSEYLAGHEKALSIVRIPRAIAARVAQGPSDRA